MHIIFDPTFIILCLRILFFVHLFLKIQISLRKNTKPTRKYNPQFCLFLLFLFFFLIPVLLSTRLFFKSTTWHLIDIYIETLPIFISSFHFRVFQSLAKHKLDQTATTLILKHHCPYQMHIFIFKARFWPIQDIALSGPNRTLAGLFT